MPPGAQVNPPSVEPAPLLGYEAPDAAVTRIVDALPTPRLVLRPDGMQAVLATYSAMPSVADIAQPFERLAGLRIDPKRHAARRTRFFAALDLLELREGAVPRPIDSAVGARVVSFAWSPTGRHVAFLRWEDEGLDLWVCDALEGKARRIASQISEAIAPGYVWLPGGDALLVSLRVEHQAPLPPRAEIPHGPTIEDTAGRKATLRTYQDLLKDRTDEARFEHLATAQLAVVTLVGDTPTLLGDPAMVTDFEPSPDGQYAMIHRLRRPFSYEVPYYRFPRSIEVIALRDGKLVASLAEQELEDEIPIGGVRTGLRSLSWHPQEPASVLWWEALDGGDPDKPAEFRDRVMRLAAPFQDPPQELLRTAQRLRGVSWTEISGQVIVREFDRDRRWTTVRVHELGSGLPPRILVDRSIRDVYGDPGDPIYATRTDGTRVVVVDDGAIYLTGAGASADGERPFVDRMSLQTGQTSRMFASDPAAHEEFVDFIGPPREGRMLLRRESPTEVPNYVVTDGGDRVRLTHFEDPHPELTGIEKRILNYRRKDGVALSGILYLPPGATPGQRFPLVVWAYPLEFNDKDTAGQVRAAPRRFTRLAGTSPLMFLTRGYALLDNASMPIVGDPETMNDTFIAQVVASAEAAVDAVVAEGVADRDRVAIAGHSYGAFMVANLLAHSQLFKAGIARSGAYNRTLTPFGYQSERRTLWEAPQTYVEVSPLFSADKIDEPLLLVHGELDSNAGTYPMQSRRLYQAIAGTGGTARLVILPFESHGYVARESVLHVLEESFRWLDRYVKSAGPAPSEPAPAEPAPAEPAPSEPERP